MNKTRSISRTSLSNKITRIEKPTEIDIVKYNKDLSGLSVHGEILSSVTPDQQCIPRNNKRKKTPNTLIIRKQPILEPVNPIKRAK